jgi:hypothetical protein
MTMKLYRQGLDYSRLLKLLSHQTQTYSKRGYVEHYTASSKIVAGSLFIRQQKRFTTTQRITTLRDISFVICPHTRFSSLKVRNEYRDITNRTYWKESHGRLIKCKYCLTEFQIDFKEFRKQGNAIYFTKWQDLGQGVSPLDYKWQSHVGESDRLWKRVKFDRGSIYTAFEGKEHVEFEFNSLILTG